MVFSTQSPVFYPTGSGLMHQGQPVLHPPYPTMFPPQMLTGPGGQRQQMMMFPPQQTTSTAQMQASKRSRHYLPTTQALSQMYPQQPQQPSAQLQPKPEATTKRATRTLCIVDPDTDSLLIWSVNKYCHLMSTHLPVYQLMLYITEHIIHIEAQYDVYV